MPTIAVTAAALDQLTRARDTAENELHKMHHINYAFRGGRRAFMQHGYSDADFRKFADALERHPEYGPVPFSPPLIAAKKMQIERLEKEIATGKRLLTPAIAG